MIGKDLELAARLLRDGKLVAIPTETVYGLAANALDPIAVSKIFEVKGRPQFNPLIVHLASIDQMDQFAIDVPLAAKKLAEACWPGPLSLLLKKKAIIPDIVTAGLESVVLRVPQHPLTLDLLNKLDFPLAAPSANLFKKISPTLPQHVEKGLGKKVSYILDGGASAKGLESTIVSFLDEQAEIMRFGSLSREEIEAVIGRVSIGTQHSSNPLTPGQLDQHYASQKPLYLVEDIENAIEIHRDKKAAVISFGDELFEEAYSQYFLSEEEDLHKAAANLFAMMHEADADDSDLILVRLLPATGLGLAINDRLKRASRAH